MNDLGYGKTVCILSTVVVCLAILWPVIFYPMLVGYFGGYTDTSGCCDILLEKDVNAVNLIVGLCSNVLQEFPDSLYSKNKNLNKEMVNKCRSIVLETCTIDINLLIKDRVQLGPNYKRVLEDMRIVNNSLCLKYNFGITLDFIGAPHRMKMRRQNTSSTHLKQERPIHVHPEMMHPAMRDRSRAVPPSHILPIVAQQYANPSDIPIAPQRPPLPGMRPPMGLGAGHVASQPRGGGLMSVIMPLYTLGIILFFAYTVFKLLSKRNDDPPSDYTRDSKFRNTVFNKQANPSNKPSTTPQQQSGNQKFGSVEEESLRRRLAEADAAINYFMKRMDAIVTESTAKNNEEKQEPAMEKPAEGKPKFETVTDNEKIQKGSVQVVGMETTESCEGGKHWNAPISPPAPSKPVEVSTKPVSIFLPGTIPSNSRVLVSDTHTESIPSESSVILESKVTLNVISSKPQENGANALDEDEEQDAIDDISVEGFGDNYHNHANDEFSEEDEGDEENDDDEEEQEEEEEEDEEEEEEEYEKEEELTVPDTINNSDVEDAIYNKNECKEKLEEEEQKSAVVKTDLITDNNHVADNVPVKANGNVKYEEVTDDKIGQVDEENCEKSNDTFVNHERHKD